MWRKRSIRHRYWEVLKRLRLVPGIAILPIVGFAPHQPSTSQSVEASTASPLGLVLAGDWESRAASSMPGGR